ncbi:MAG: A24 family peptidase [Acidimicrobiia bacterium]
MINILAGAFGFFGAFGALDLAAQALHDSPLRPYVGTCPRCGVRRGWLTIHCPGCGRPAYRETPLVLLATIAAVLFSNTLGQSWALVAYLGFLMLSLALGVTDIDALRIVDRLNLRGTALLIGLLGVAALMDGSSSAFGRSLLGGLAYLAGTALVFLVAGGRGFGFGDVKLSVQLGVFTSYISWGTLGWAVFITAILGGVVSLGVLMVATIGSRGKDSAGPDVKSAMQAELPYGPWMILGAWTAIALAGLGAFPLPS